MNMRGLKKWWGPRAGEILAQMLAQGFVRCPNCDGLPWGPLLAAHQAGCSGRVGWGPEQEKSSLDTSGSP